MNQSLHTSELNTQEPKSASQNIQSKPSQPQGEVKTDKVEPHPIIASKDTNQAELTAPETRPEEENVEKKVNEQSIKSKEKPSKRQSLKSKHSAKMSHKKIQMEKDQMNSAAMKALGASGRTLKEGHNQVKSNVREYSVQKQREDIPVTQPKKINTESKRTKLPHSDNKSKTEAKDIRGEKTALVTSTKRSNRTNEEIAIAQKANEEKEEEKRVITRSRSKRNKDEQQMRGSASRSKKRQRRSKSSDKEVDEQKEEVEANFVEPKMKSEKKSKDSEEKGVSIVKAKNSKSALKSAAKSGVKKVKVDLSSAKH